MAGESSSMSVILVLGASCVARCYKAKIVTRGLANPSTSQSFGRATATVGFVIDTRRTISPMVQLPISETNDNAASYNFDSAKALNV
jgi:hypothetical protein